jgi:murein DD-endopeptidase MepM/ murein hydrolase activator NlpD
MANRFHIRRASRIWWINSLSLVLYLAASSGAVGAEEGAQAHPSGEISGRTGDPPYGTMVASEHPLVRYLLEELITQRLENSQLHADLTAAGARLAEIGKGALEKEAALAAWIVGLRDELAQREAQLALTTAARESGARLLEEARAAEASGRAHRQLAAVETKLKEQDRQMAIVQSVAEGLAQRLRWRLALLEDEVERLQSHDDIAQLWLKDWVRGSVEALEDLFLETGIDVERLVARAASGPAPAQGGPLQVAGPDEIVASATSSTGDSTSGNIHRFAVLQRIARTVPLASPLDQFYVTSPYGKRRDPFTNTWAYHAGLDLGAPRNSKVLATAPGRVVVAGPSGPYGQMVEIDHGLGILTRYGHLQSIHVAVGNEVHFRQELGMIGNTGRSTSRHLHYEILIDDRVVDPARFLNAGRLLIGVLDTPRRAAEAGR